jgi:diguanylate cyclase (GGDEF)-like protein
LLQIFLAISVSCSLLLAASVDHVSEKERTEARWRHQATHDSLTGLPNRSLFSVALNSALHHAGTSNPTRLVVCDLDNFKQVNDTWGHVAGDELLRVIAERMASSVRANDVVARISGDEFALLLNDADEAVAAEVANRVMAAVMVPVCLPSGSMVVPSISMGIAANDRGENVGQLMTRADATMYRAKALGGRQVMHS